MIRKTRMVAAVAAAFVGASMMTPAMASADSSFGSQGFAASTATASSSQAPQEYGLVQSDAVGGTDGVQVGGPFALSLEALGSLGNILPNPGGGGGDTETGDPFGSLFAYCDGGLMVTYDNSQKSTPTEFLLTVNGVQLDTEIVPAEQSRGYTFTVPLGSVVVIFGDDVELASLNTSDCQGG